MTVPSQVTLVQRPEHISFLIAGLVVLSSACVFSEEAESEIDCDELPESKQALCKLLKQCSLIDNEETRQRCYELALGDETLDAEGDLPEDIQELLDSLEAESESTASATSAVTTKTDTKSVGNGATKTEEANEGKRNRRGLLGRLTGALTAPVRAVLPSGERKSVQDPASNKNQSEDLDGNEQTKRWNATIEKVGRVDRDVHLILLDDGNLFEYIAPAELRFRKNDTVEVIHVQTWLTEKYRIDGNRGAIRDALLIPCDREDLKGKMKRKCTLMGLD